MERKPPKREAPSFWASVEQAWTATLEAVAAGKDVRDLPAWANSALLSIGGYNAVWETYRRAPQELVKLRQTFFLACRNHHELHGRQATGT